MDYHELDKRIQTLETIVLGFANALKQESSSLGVVDDASAYLYAAKRYGIGYDKLQVECSINSDGSAQIIRDVSITAHSSLNVLDTFLLIPEADPKSKGTSWDIRLLEASSPSSDRSISIKEGSSVPGNSSTLIIISPELNSGERMTYQLREDIDPGLFAIDFSPEKLAKRKTPRDYFGWHINRPTRDLSINVYFPEGHLRPAVFGREVAYASSSSFPSIQKQTEENNRLEACSIREIGGRYVLSLDVDYPMTGLIYQIVWEPIPKITAPISVDTHRQDILNNVGIPSELSQQLFNTLFDCVFFDNPEDFENLFIDNRLTPWLQIIPEAKDRAGRVRALINRFHNRFNTNDENALVLFLNVAADNLHPEDKCKKLLTDLSNKLAEIKYNSAPN